MLWWAVCRKLRLISCDMKSKNVFFVLKAIGVSAAYIIGTEIMVTLLTLAYLNYYIQLEIFGKIMKLS